MRKTAKKVAIDNTVKYRFAFRSHKCCICHDLIRFEFVYKVPQVNVSYCSQCVTSKQHAYELVVNRHITAADILQSNQIKYLQNEVEKYKTYEEAIDQIVKDILNLPDGEVSPMVHSVLVKYVS